MKKKDPTWLSFILILVLFVIGTGFLIVEYNYLENTLGQAKFFLISALSGILLILLFHIVNIFFFSKGKKIKNKSSILIYIYVFFLSPVLLSFSNRKLSKSAIKCETYIVEEVDYRTKKGRKQYWLHLKTGKSVEQFSIKEIEYQDFLIETKLSVCSRKGFFGFSVVEEIKKLDR